jgi:hypothetical protein
MIGGMSKEDRMMMFVLKLDKKIAMTEVQLDYLKKICGKCLRKKM